MKKKLLWIAGIIVVLLAVYFIGTGFSKCEMVCLMDFEVSGDGREVTLKTGIGASMGYVRKASVTRREDGRLYVDFISAFGGLNGSIGARDIFTLPLDEDTCAIAFCRNAGVYTDVMIKGDDGIWQMVSR